MDFLALRQELIRRDFGKMNDRQFEAVTTVNGPLLVLAGAGSGKTTVLVNRIANLVQYGNAYRSDFVPPFSENDLAAARDYLDGKCDRLESTAFAVDAPRPWEILAITFTNKAADELRARINAKISAGGEDIWAGTFHSVCGKFLRYYADRIGFSSRFTVYDTDDQKRLMKSIMKQENIDEKYLPPKAVLSAISAAKDELISPAEFEQQTGFDLRRREIARLYKIYQKRLAEADAMDFDDMICHTVRLLRENEDVLQRLGGKFRYIMVDEYQDTNHAQYELIRLLSSVHGNLCVVGDDDQSIYRFRGATIENILSFEATFKGAKVIRLEQNYRSTSHILDAANAVIANNRGRKGKTLWTDLGAGEKIQVYTAPDDRAEARFVADEILDSVRAGHPFSAHAVLYRTNAQSASFENVFARSGISYRIIGGMRFYERKEIRDLLAYLHLVNNHHDDLRLRRIINEPKRGIGDTTVSHAADFAAEQGIPLFRVFAEADTYAALSRAAAKLKEFCRMIEALTDLAETLPMHELFAQVMKMTGYEAALLAEGTPEAADRLENIKQLGVNIEQYEQEHPEATLADFLEEIALVSDIDAMNASEDRVLLMTVHSAKGLEFDRVFLVGMEEGLFPGTQSIYGGEAEIEEERRLAYVAITRARKVLTVTNASSRMLFGSTNRNLPSRFLREIPEELCNDISPAAPTRYSFTSFDAKPAHSGFSGGGFANSPFKAHPAKSAAAAQKPSGNPGVYRLGMTVRHTAFGEGKIQKITPMGGDTLLEIAFGSGVGTKKIMAAYTKLEILN